MNSNIIARHKETNSLYKYIDGTTFENLINGKQKELSPDELSDLTVTLKLTEMVNKNPLLLTLIKNLKLQYEPLTNI